MTIVQFDKSARPPAFEYARLLVKLNELDLAGQGNSEDASALTDDMDAPWYAMSKIEQDRLRELSGDLNALVEGGPKRVEMSAEELAKWQEAKREAFNRLINGDVDAALHSLRQPIPKNLPKFIVPFLQARCWERFGDYETALVFMKEAQTHDRSFGTFVSFLLEKLGRHEELAANAIQILKSVESSPVDVYFAATFLLFPRHLKDITTDKDFIKTSINSLKRAYKDVQRLAPNELEVPNCDAEIATVLGFCYERLHQLSEAIAIYDDALSRHKSDPVLHLARGLARYNNEPTAAIQDFSRAAQLGVQSIWPYSVLARHALIQGRLGDAIQFGNQALHQRGPEPALAEVYETLAIAYAKLGQKADGDFVLGNFDRAIALDSTNESIQRNRRIAVQMAQEASPTKNRRFPDPAELVIKSRQLHQTQTTMLETDLRALKEQRGFEQLGGVLAQAS